MPSLVLESTWANAGGTVIIYLAALTSVNPELYEAASVDGAGLWKKIWHVTLPQMRTVLLVTMILQIIGTAQVFLEPYLFTSGGPDNATMTVLLLDLQLRLRQLARRRLRRGGGAEPDAGRVPRGVLADLPARHALLERRMSAHPLFGRDACARTRDRDPAGSGAVRRLAAAERQVGARWRPHGCCSCCS